MSVNVSPGEKQVNLIAKHPLSYIIGMLVLMVGIFVGSTFLSHDQEVENLKEQVTFERQRADREAAARIKSDADRYELARELLQTNKILIEKKVLIDSAVRQTINK